MQWSEAIKPYVSELKPVKKSPDLIHRVISLVDYTSLNDDDTDSSIAKLVNKAVTPLGHVAAVCVYPKFVRLVAAERQNPVIKIATVVNFPSGTGMLEESLIEINDALQDGAEEIDVVFPYQRYMTEGSDYAYTYVEGCKAACGDALLKVILETGALRELSVIADASRIALEAGADFIKTSTGKISTGATFEAAATMLLVIKELSMKSHRSFGLKVSGGVRELEQAAQYIELAEKIMGKDWVTPHTFRIGASKLLDDLVVKSN